MPKESKWRLRVIVIYADNYKNINHYHNIIDRYINNNWQPILESTSYDNHGGYTILIKDRYSKEDK